MRPPLSASRAALGLTVCALTCACDPDPGVDAGTDAGPSCTPLGAYDAPTSEGAADPLAAAPGTASAGRLEASELPPNPDGLADYRAGDYVLTNGRVAAIVSDATAPGQSYDPFGGRLVGLTRVEGGALVAPSDYNLLMLALGRFSLATEAVGVVADGSDGGPAIVRATGHLDPIRALADLLDALLPGDFEGLPASIDFSLAPDADVVEATLRVRAPRSGLRARLGAVQVFFQGFRTPPWRPGSGFTNASGPLDYLAFEDPRGTSFAWLGAEGEPLDPLFGMSGVDIFTGSGLFLAPCAEGEITLGRMAIGGPGLPGVQRVVAGLSGSATRRVTGRVVNADGSPASDARVHVTTADGEHLTRLWPEPDGTFSLEVDDRAAQVHAFRVGSPVAGPVDVGDSVVLTMPATGTIRVDTVEAGSLTAIPARVEVSPASGEPPRAPDAWGELLPGEGRSRLEFPTDGAVDLALPPGDYRVDVSRGPEYERFEATVTVAEGADVPVHVELERVVPTPGVLCADYHIHSHRSIDSDDPGSAKVRSLAADGLEIAVRSEHEWVSDYQPVVDSLGLSDFVRGFAGLELTTFTYGHFGVFPLQVDRARPSGGAIP